MSTKIYAIRNEDTFGGYDLFTNTGAPIPGVVGVRETMGADGVPRVLIEIYDAEIRVVDQVSQLNGN